MPDPIRFRRFASLQRLFHRPAEDELVGQDAHRAPDRLAQDGLPQARD